ncbi:MAG: hypothetical protein AAF564_22275 [Bacteroidota bacterium]
MTDVHDDHWRLWASASREGHRIGYYSQNILHAPTADWNDENEPAPKPYSREDFDIADQIANLVLTLSDALKRAVVVYWGAYPDAPYCREERFKEFGIDRSNCRKQARQAMDIVNRRV